MKIRIGDVDYRVVSHRGASLLHLLELRQQSHAVLGEPFGLSQLDAMEKRSKQIRADLKRAKAAGDQAEVARLDAAMMDDGVLWMAVVIFLARRQAGEQVSFRDAVDVDLGAVEWVEEDGDRVPTDDGDEGGDEPDPTSPGSGSPATAASSTAPRPGAAKKAGRSTRTGSKTRSASGSR